MPQRKPETTTMPAPADEPQFRMVDVGRKRLTRRRAVAAGAILVGREAFGKIRDKTLAKGDVLALAEIAGVMGAKKTPELIPLCHTLPLDHASIHCVLQAPDTVMVYCQTAAYARTGVEMEAVMGVQAALATIWDLTKGTEPALEIGNVRLLAKEGGKGGLWLNPHGVPDWLARQFAAPPALEGVTAAVLVVSDRAASKAYEDKSGPVLNARLAAAGAALQGYAVMPDEKEAIERQLQDFAQQNIRLVFISGGTGLSGRDVTPEAVQSVCTRLIPGFGELLRQDGAQMIDTSWLSRSLAGTLGSTLVVALPGSPKAVGEGLDALLPILRHALATLEGGAHG